MNATAWTVSRTLLRRSLPLAGWYWVILYLAWAVVIGLTARLGTVEVSMWANVGLQAPRWFTFVFGITAVGAYLPVFVAHGVTRRDALIGAWGFLLPYAVGFAVMTTVGFGVEYLTFDALGLFGGLTEPYPVDSLGAAAAICLEFTLVYLGYTAAGALCAIAYHLINPWWATLLLPVALLPAFVIEIGFRTEWAGLVLGRLLGLGDEGHLGAGAIVALATLLVASAVTWVLVRRLPIKKITG
ncbi:MULTISPECIES: hypothetical protein [unclassified Solwaraspora]|uniref:hypothetical protein n=1 Tax=unclassified Solwaraspora TaxID=2627926 RepID=UPI00259BEF5C|nr:hypothetical protein [Solwaraspora sp. WMMA2056]WJK42938.1 hypothetical protein O7608_11415 [Solwaraspora sp. WMMA2056]